MGTRIGLSYRALNAQHIEAIADSQRVGWRRYTPIWGIRTRHLQLQLADDQQADGLYSFFGALD
jgi:hypothetical protein